MAGEPEIFGVHKNFLWWTKMKRGPTGCQLDLEGTQKNAECSWVGIFQLEKGKLQKRVLKKKPLIGAFLDCSLTQKAVRTRIFLNLSPAAPGYPNFAVPQGDEE